MAQHLSVHELLHVFSFLEARDLLCAAQVNKVWNEVSQTKELWRQLCLRRWSSRKASQMVLGAQTWKQYYFCRSKLEFRVESGRPGKDFVCRAIGGHSGPIDQLAYVSTSEYRFDGMEKSVVCTVSSDRTVRAWDLLKYCEHHLPVAVAIVQDGGSLHICALPDQGIEIWSSSLQPAPLVNLVTYPRLQLVVTLDNQGLIKVWEAETGQELASFSLPTACCTLEACDHPEGSYLLVTCVEGNLYTLKVLQLQVVSKVTVFPSASVSLCCSPDRQWVFASAQDLVMGPKVFCTQSLLCPSEDKSPVCTTLHVRLSFRVCWAPDEAARVIVMHRSDDHMQLVVTTFELRTNKSRDGVDILVQQVASFVVPDTMKPPHVMQGHGSQVILLASGLKLVLFTIHGLELVAFQDHHRPITSVWVDPNRVITSSLDLSLRVYVWNKENKFPVLKSCYHLLGGSHKWASGFTHVVSDQMNIVGVETRSIGTSILRSYCFQVQHG